LSRKKVNPFPAGRKEYFAQAQFLGLSDLLVHSQWRAEADMRPVMLVVAGPPGGGKSTLFPNRERGIDLNADDVA
jgi:hypothetical protein